MRVKIATENNTLDSQNTFFSLIYKNNINKLVQNNKIIKAIEGESEALGIGITNLQNIKNNKNCISI